MRIALVIALLAGGCQSDLDAAFVPAELDRPYFDCRVQPVLTKYCSQQACHGDTGRYFRVYARNRLRDGGDEAQRNAFMRAEERSHNYDAARAFVDLEHPDKSLILKKPLEQEAGGYFHRGATLYSGANVFATADDPDYAIIAQWVGGATETPTCQEPGSNL